jgi:hypothetical protein
MALVSQRIGILFVCTEYLITSEEHVKIGRYL